MVHWLSVANKGSNKQKDSNEDWIVLPSSSTFINGSLNQTEDQLRFPFLFSFWQSG